MMTVPCINKDVSLVSRQNSGENIQKSTLNMKFLCEKNCSEIARPLTQDKLNVDYSEFNSFESQSQSTLQTT